MKKLSKRGEEETFPETRDGETFPEKLSKRDGVVDGGEGDDTYLDYGCSSLKDLEDMFYKESVHAYQKAYSKVILSNVFKERIGMDTTEEDPTVSIDKFVENFKKSGKGKLVGILPYKLFKIDFIKVDREENFVNDLQPMIDKSLEIINHVKSFPLEDRTEKLLDFFPEKRKAPVAYDEIAVDLNEEELLMIKSIQCKS